MDQQPATRFQRKDAGLLIAIEGIDGSGKTTQCRELAAWLNALGVAVCRLSEPTKGPIGEEIRRLARSGRPDPQREFELFLADRKSDVHSNILPALGRSEVVIMDRYYISSIAYQGASGLPMDHIQAANEAIAPRPDLVLVLKVPVRVALDRVKARDEHGPNLFEREDYLSAVDACFDRLQWPEIHRLDSGRSVAEIHTDVRRLVQPHLTRVGLSGRRAATTK